MVFLVPANCWVLGDLTSLKDCSCQFSAWGFPFASKKCFDTAFQAWGRTWNRWFLSRWIWTLFLPHVNPQAIDGIDELLVAAQSQLIQHQTKKPQRRSLIKLLIWPHHIEEFNINRMGYRIHTSLTGQNKKSDKTHIIWIRKHQTGDEDLNPSSWNVNTANATPIKKTGILRTPLLNCEIILGYKLQTNCKPTLMMGPKQEYDVTP